VVVSTYLIRMKEDVAFVRALHAFTLLWRASTWSFADIRSTPSCLVHGWLAGGMWKMAGQRFGANLSLTAEGPGHSTKMRDGHYRVANTDKELQAVKGRDWH
jgi:hypothetical protein